MPNLIQVDADELEKVIKNYDALTKQAQATIEKLTSENEQLSIKLASDASQLSNLQIKAADAMVQFGVIVPEQRQLAIDQLADSKNALEILATVCDRTKHASAEAKRIGTVEKAANQGTQVKRAGARFNEDPQAKKALNDQYLEQLLG